MPEDENDRRKRGNDLFRDLFGPGSAFENIFEAGGPLDTFFGGNERRATGDAQVRRDTAAKEGQFNYETEYKNLARLVRTVAGLNPETGSLSTALNRFGAWHTLLNRVLSEVGVEMPDNGRRFIPDQLFDQFRRHLKARHAAATSEAGQGAVIDALRSNIRDAGEAMGLVDPTDPIQLRGGAAELKVANERLNTLYRELSDLLGIEEPSAIVVNARVSELLDKERVLSETAYLNPKLSRLAGEYREALESIEVSLGWDPKDTTNGPREIAEEVQAYVDGLEAMKARALDAEDKNGNYHDQLIRIANLVGQDWIGDDLVTIVDEHLNQDLTDQNHIAKSEIERMISGITQTDTVREANSVLADSFWRLLTEHDLQRPPFIALTAGDIIRAVDYGALGVDPHIAVSYELASGRWVFTMLGEEGQSGSNERTTMRRERDAAFERVQNRQGPPPRSKSLMAASAENDRSAHIFGIVDNSEQPADPRLDRLISLLAIEAQRKGDEDTAKTLRHIRDGEEN